MSIQGAIDSHVEAGRLHQLGSLVSGDETVRIMYVTEEIFRVVHPSFAETFDGERLSELRQTLDAFLEGGEFSVATNPRCKPANAMLARVAPVDADFWDIRSIDPKPGIRVLGAFVAQDTFVALTWNYRENLDEPGAWDAEITRCMEVWRGLFGTEHPLKGGTVDDYLTNYYLV